MRFLFCELLRGSFKNDLTTIESGFWSDLDNVVGILNNIGLMLDNKEGIADIDEAVKDGEKFLNVAEMKSGCGLV